MAKHFKGSILTRVVQATHKSSSSQASKTNLVLPISIIFALVLALFGAYGCSRSIANIGGGGIENEGQVGTAEAGESTDASRVDDETSAGDDEGSGSLERENEMHYYNSELQGNSDPSDDCNFGPNPYIKGKDVLYYDSVFRNRNDVDGALLAASIGWMDACTSTQFLSEYYRGAQFDRGLAMNDAKLDFASNKAKFGEYKDAFFRYLDRAEKIELRECRSVTDQMYMEPITINGAPDIIVRESHDNSGHELVYSFRIKGELVEVAYRVECGFQPTNVAEIMKITPEPEESTTPEPTPTPTSTPTPTPDPDPTPTPDPDPTPEPEYKKDITQGTPADPGVGHSADTNNGVGSQTSSAQTESTPSTYEEYEERVEKTESAVGSESDTTPTTETPPDTTVHNDGAEAANQPVTEGWSNDVPEDEKPNDGYVNPDI